MNKLVKLGLVMLLALGLVACSSKEEEKKQGEVIVINAEDVIKKMDNDETFIWILTQTTCSHCIAFEPHFTEVALEEGVTIYQLVADTDSSEDTNAVQTLLTTYGLEYTPTTVLVKDGEVKDTTVGDMSVTDFTKYLKDHGYLK